MDTKPQKPVKLFKYKISYTLANGDFQDYVVPVGAKESAVFNALQALLPALTPSSPVSKITIDIGNRQDTA